jgi:hypothetical protein
MTSNAEQTKPSSLFPAFAADEQEAAYKVYLTIIERMRQEGTLTEAEEERLLTKAAEVQKKLREHSIAAARDNAAA